MDYKRLEIYVGWTCNQKCTYCVEYSTMEKSWKKIVSIYDIFKTLLKYKKLGYNHVTFLGGEPFIQPVFYDALKIGKKFGYTILVTTNATTIHIDSQAKKYLPYIDQLILSFEAIDKDLQQKISRTNVFVSWELVFKNIYNYWKGNYLKANIVITKDNLFELLNIINYIYENGIKDIAITYPDIELGYYSVEHIKEKIAPKYEDCLNIVLDCVSFCKEKSINLKLADFPLCLFFEEKKHIDEYIKILDDYHYQERLKLSNDNKEWYRGLSKDVRDKSYLKDCNNCIYKGVCKGVGEEYNLIFPNFGVKPF